MSLISITFSLSLPLFPSFCPPFLPSSLPVYDDTVSDTLVVSSVVSPFLTLPSFYCFFVILCFFSLPTLLLPSLSSPLSSQLLLLVLPLLFFCLCLAFVSLYMFLIWLRHFTMERRMKARALLPLLHRLPCLQKRNNCPAFQSIQDRQRAPSLLFQQKDSTLSPLPLKEENSPHSETQAQDSSTSISVQKVPQNSNQPKRLFQLGT